MVAYQYANYIDLRSLNQNLSRKITVQSNVVIDLKKLNNIFLICSDFYFWIFYNYQMNKRFSDKLAVFCNFQVNKLLWIFILLYDDLLFKYFYLNT